MIGDVQLTAGRKSQKLYVWGQHVIFFLKFSHQKVGIRIFALEETEESQEAFRANCIKNVSIWRHNSVEKLMSCMRMRKALAKKQQKIMRKGKKNWVSKNFI